MFLFLFYTLASYPYHVFLNNKLSNEKAFLFTWLTSPFIVSYFFIYNIYAVFMIIIQLISYIVLFKYKLYSIIYYGIPFLATFLYLLLLFLIT
ncbi:hypothetical protein IC006_1090 [Sulfuracidifex tepidarius]|uniref:Uncharacterized protein n=1 Tax=Sulfuracidifex tepidarius TaxID=1294262 RepID=A0A510E397_9CREN|nr:hypothetical protein IC006_1090 [Sulfuracidifex tepidarius]BBG26550.1 hypothetical protein IC007_1065 [Sulfuracidifex tepidarius]